MSTLDLNSWMLLVKFWMIVFGYDFSAETIYYSVSDLIVPTEETKWRKHHCHSNVDTSMKSAVVV